MSPTPAPLDGDFIYPDGTSCNHGFLGMLGSCPLLEATDPIAAAAKEEIFKLMRLAFTRGADINWRHPRSGIPTTWDLVVNDHVESAILLLDLGAAAEWKPPAHDVTNIADMASLRQGSGAGARVHEALMRQRIRAVGLDTRAPSASTPSRRVKAL